MTPHRLAELNKLMELYQEFQKQKEEIGKRYVVPESPDDVAPIGSPNPLVANELEQVRRHLAQQIIQREPSKPLFRASTESTEKLVSDRHFYLLSNLSSFEKTTTKKPIERVKVPKAPPSLLEMLAKKKDDKKVR